MDKKQINREIRNISNSTSLTLLLFIGLMFLMEYGFSYIYKKFIFSSFPDTEDLFLFIIYIFLYLIIVPLVLFIFYKTRGKKVNLKFKTPFKKSNLSVGWCIKWIVIAVGFAYIASFISNLIFFIIEQLTGTSLHALKVGAGDSFFGVLTILTAVPIFAPIFEELMFRGTLYRNSEPMGQWFAIVVSGLMFGLWHENYAQFIFAWVVGIFLAFIYARTRSIFPCMIIHFIINSIGTVSMLVSINLDMEVMQSGDTARMTAYLENHMIEYLLTSCVGMAVIGFIIAAIVLFIIELVKYRRVFYLQKSCFNISTLKKTLVYFSAPATIVLFAYMIFATVYNALYS